MSQSQTRALLSQDAECVRRVVATVDAIDLNVVSSAMNVVKTLGVDVEVDLWVAVDTNVDEVRDGDGLERVAVEVRCSCGCRGGDAGEEGSGNEFHDVCVNW